MVPVNPPAPSEAPPPAVEADLTLPQARRLLWRAGFGPAPGQAEALAGQPVQQVVFSLTRPSGAAVLQGPEPHNEEGEALQPADARGEDHCWWLDRMIRSDQPLVERMTYIWHDWFANSNEKVNDQQLMLDQNEPVPRTGAGQLPRTVPGGDHQPGDADLPGRHLQQPLGTERELRARDDGAVLTRRRPRRLHRGRRQGDGPLADRVDGRMDRKQRAAELPLRRRTPRQGVKTVFGQSGNFNYADAVSLCVSPSVAPVVLRQQAVELLRAGAAAGSHARVAAGDLPVLRLLDPLGRGGDPPEAQNSSTARNW